jgi:hypothetical protein
MRPELSAIVPVSLTVACSFLFTAMAQAALAPPTNPNAVSYSASRIDITWQDQSTNETGFEIARSSTGPYGTRAADTLRSRWTARRSTTVVEKARRLLERRPA